MNTQLEYLKSVLLAECIYWEEIDDGDENFFPRKAICNKHDNCSCKRIIDKMKTYEINKVKEAIK